MFTVHRLPPSGAESCHIELIVQFVAKFSFGTSGAGAAVATAKGEFSSNPANREKSYRSGIGGVAGTAETPASATPAPSSENPTAAAQTNTPANARRIIPE
jgi:hypothetical protein